MSQPEQNNNMGVSWEDREEEYGGEREEVFPYLILMPRKILFSSLCSLRHRLLLRKEKLTRGLVNCSLILHRFLPIMCLPLSHLPYPQSRLPYLPCRLFCRLFRSLPILLLISQLLPLVLPTVRLPTLIDIRRRIPLYRNTLLILTLPPKCPIVIHIFPLSLVQMFPPLTLPLFLILLLLIHHR